MQPVSAVRSRNGASAWRAVLAGLCASLVGVGLARFAYTPLIPALIEAGWFAPAAAVYLGAANLAGYLAGALLGRHLARPAGAARALRATMLLASASFFACAAPLSFGWFFAWRFAAGAAGGVLMVLAAPAALSAVAPARHGLAAGAVFTGVGLGIALSGTLVPLLLRLGLVATWCGLGALALLLSALAWGGWPEQAPGAPPASAPARAPGAGVPLRALYLEYGLGAAGLVPHMVFLVDFVARGLGRGLAAGAACWVLFGLGASLGPVLAGRLADRIGFRLALRLAFLVQAAAVAWLALAPGALVLALSSLVIGASLPGVVPLVLGRVQELAGAGAERRSAAWSVATAAFALGQAGAAYGFSFLFARTGSHVLLFELGALALLLALVIDLAASRASGARSAAVQAQPALRPGIGGERRRGRDLGP